MRTIFLFFTFFLSLFCNGWEIQWTEGQKMFDVGNYSAAEQAFNLAIAELEKNHDKEHPYIYLDRALLFIEQKKYAEALSDLNCALASDHLNNSDRMRGLLARMRVGCHSKMDEQVLADYETFKTIHPNFPKTEFQKDKIIIRNVPNCDCYKKLATKLLVTAEICEKESDIQMFSTGVCIIKRKLWPEQVASSFHSKHCNQCVDDCKFWCNKCALVGIDWCVNVFKTYKCEMSCICAVDLIKDRCNWCCRKGHSDDRCVRPFENILYNMDRRCETGCDD